MILYFFQTVCCLIYSVNRYFYMHEFGVIILTSPAWPIIVSSQMFAPYLFFFTEKVIKTIGALLETWKG